MNIGRRGFLRTLGAIGVFLPVAGALPRLLRASTHGPKRLLQIFLAGGWDSALATDPVVGPKASGTGYQSAYSSLAVPTVPGKPSLRVGWGLAPAAPAFASMPTAFLNGIHMEVTAHELAQNYILSGKLSLSNSREFPAIPARMGRSSGAFPPHVVLGARVPLGDTAGSAPPLQATSPGALSSMLAGARDPDTRLAEVSIQAAESLLQTLNDLRVARLSEAAKSALGAWTSAEKNLGALYARDFSSRLKLTAATKARYGYADESDPEALLAAAFLVLKSGMSPYVTVGFGSGDLDTHTNHLDRHVPALRRFSAAFAKLCEDIVATPDPAEPGKNLSQTTTILVTSEFVRTPKFNSEAGTDHWQSASTILMGAGVRDGAVLGATSDAAAPMGWKGGAVVPFSTDTALLPDHVASAILRKFGFADAAAEIGPPGEAEGAFA